MSRLFKALKRIFFWRYSRTTWHYDVLCALILAFIFLTPKSWFANGEPRSEVDHQNTVQHVYIPVDTTITSILNKTEVERRVRAVTGNPGVTVVDYRIKSDEKGNPAFYEVDIR